MDDFEDLLEAFDDIEDIGEEIFEPEELVEDLIEDPAEILLAIAVLITGTVAVIVLLILLLFLILTTGPIAILATFAGITFFITFLSVGLFIYFRTNIPRHVEKKVNKALEEAENEKRKGESMTEEEAINRIKKEYSEGDMTEEELENALDEVVKHDQNQNRSLNNTSSARYFSLHQITISIPRQEDLNLRRIEQLLQSYLEDPVMLSSLDDLHFSVLT